MHRMRSPASLLTRFLYNETEQQNTEQQRVYAQKDELFTRTM